MYSRANKMESSFNPLSRSAAYPEPKRRSMATGAGNRDASAAGDVRRSVGGGGGDGDRPSSLMMASSMLHLLDELDALLADMPTPKQAVITDINASDFQVKPQKAIVSPPVAPKPKSNGRKKPSVTSESTITPATVPAAEDPEHDQEHDDNVTDLDDLLNTLNDPNFLEKMEPTGAPEPAAAAPAVEEPADPGAVTPGSVHSEPAAIGSRPDVKSLLSELSQSVADSPAASGPTSPVTASTATRELDELMANLSSFQASGGVKAGAVPITAEEDPASAKYAKPRKNKPSSPPPTSAVAAAAAPAEPSSEGNAQLNRLNDMMDTMQSDISRQGIDNQPKATCEACQMGIVGQVITAMGKTYHPEHFTCVRCNCDLATENFFERDGKAYCEVDFHQVFAPQCAQCNGPILGRCMTAVGKTFHPEHFYCHTCGKVLPSTEGFHERDGRAYCNEDYYQKFAPKCASCDHAINEAFVNAIGQLWHPECFNCMECSMPFKDGNFLENNGKPYCERHYHVSKGNIATCFACRKQVAGRVLTAMGRKYHPEHFCCSFCMQALTMGTFKERQNRPYCMSCHAKLFG
ncbi:paxillin-like isoform X2 [Sycon ciliatum]|uniref:paxillin-like isoform X2 n=1 Tax=Sycon ciliatum TaxID=27933 RepID=UPI0020AD09B8|eukprot:scpid36188/ scgid0642/ Paxillin